jgi:hypothetical protein
MNTIAKVLVSATLALGALSAQAAGVDSYPGEFVKGTNMPAAAVVVAAPSLYGYDIRIDAPSKNSSGRSVAEVRKEIVKSTLYKIDATNIAG